jgi:hypothetical protein
MIPYNEIILILIGLSVGFIFNFLQVELRERKKDKIRKERLKGILTVELNLIRSELEDSKKKWETRLEKLSDPAFDPRLRVYYPITYHFEKFGLELFDLDDPIPEHVLLVKRKLSILRNRCDVATQISNTEARNFDSFSKEKKESVRGLFRQNAHDALEKLGDTLEYAKELEGLLIH